MQTQCPVRMPPNSILAALTRSCRHWGQTWKMVVVAVAPMMSRTFGHLHDSTCSSLALVGAQNCGSVARACARSPHKRIQLSGTGYRKAWPHLRPSMSHLTTSGPRSRTYHTSPSASDKYGTLYCVQELRPSSRQEHICTSHIPATLGDQLFIPMA